MFKPNDTVLIDEYVYVVVEVYENYRGFGKHSYKCRTMGGNDFCVLKHEEITPWP